MVVPSSWGIRVLVCSAPLIVLTAGISAAAAQGSGDDRARALAIEAGRDTFRQFCSPCHGRGAKGDGPVAPLLLTAPTDLTQVNRRNNGVFPAATFEAMLMLTRLQTNAHGSQQMPIWGTVFQSVDSSATLARARVVNLLAYLESMQQ